MSEKRITILALVVMAFLGWLFIERILPLMGF